MTREEAIANLNMISVAFVEPVTKEQRKLIDDTFDMAIKALEQEPKTGHWIPTYGNVKCSVCGSVKDSREVGKATHYCDFCGARMVEPQGSEG